MVVVFMKSLYIKIFIGLLLFLIIPSIFIWHNVFSKNSKVSTLLEENSGLELIKNKDYEKFTYLEFNDNDLIVTYFIDNKTDEEKDLTYYLKPNTYDDFNKKIEELIYLKYPTFIASSLVSEDVIRTYQIKDNEIVIYFSNYDINPNIDETLYLKVNYNEIIDYLDFTLVLDSDYENEDGYSYDLDKKTIALTFDDGPNGDKTIEIIKTLNDNKAHATFFMIGKKMSSGASTIKSVLESGCEIGSHSYEHTSMKNSELTKVIESEEKTQEIYYGITGEYLKYTRPPYGAINSNVREAIDTIFITWSLDTEDWLHRDSDYIVNYVMENVKDGDIILMHDSYDSTVQAVKELLPKLYAEGYQVVSVSELAKLKNRDLESHTIYRALRNVN
jgi:peptidoglycan/xylan/chitin deacetylase (PgdA/CDA1 family)